MPPTFSECPPPPTRTCLCVKGLREPTISAFFSASEPWGGLTSPDGTRSTRSHRLGAEAVLVTTDFGPEVKPIAFTMNPAAGLPGESVGDRRAGHNGTEHVPAMKGLMASRANPVYENSPAWSGEAAFMNGVVVVRSD